MTTGTYTRLVSGFLFPVHEKFKGHSTVAARRELEESQWWSPERIETLQLERLRALLIHAGDHVPYYRAMFRDMSFDPRDLDSCAGLQQLPFLTKADIRKNAEALKSEKAVGLARSNTGGSSGEPLVFYLGKERVSHDVAAKWRATRWWGVDIGDPEIVVWGSPIELGAQDRARRARDGVFRSRVLPAFERSESKREADGQVMRRPRPRMLFGHPPALARIAQHAATKSVPMDQLGIRVAFVTSERLYDDQ